MELGFISRACVLHASPCSRRTIKSLHVQWVNCYCTTWSSVQSDISWLFHQTHEFCGCCNPANIKAADQVKATRVIGTGLTVLTLQCPRFSILVSNHYAFLQENTEYLLQSHPAFPLKIIPSHTLLNWGTANAKSHNSGRTSALSKTHRTIFCESSRSGLLHFD